MTSDTRGNFWDDLTEGSRISIPFVITPADMDDFGRLSGDLNPLHTDAAFAQAGGFSGPVVYGALIVAKISCLLGMHLPGTGCLWTGLNISFRNPLYVNDDAVLTGEVTHCSEAARMLTLKISVDVGESRIATATAETVVKNNG